MDRRFFLKLLSSSGVIFLGVFLQYLFYAYCAQHVSKADFGDISVTLALFTMLAPLLVLSGHRTVDKFLPEYMSLKLWERVKTYLVFHFRFLMIVSFCVILVSPFFSYLPDSYHHILFDFLWLLPLLSLSLFVTALLESINFQRWSIFLSLILYYAIFFFGIYLVTVVWIQKVTVLMIFVILGLSSLISSFFAWYLFSKNIPFPIGSIAQADYQDREDWVKLGKHFLYAAFFVSLFHNVTLYMTELFAGDKDMVGVFSAIMTITAYVGVFSKAVGTNLRPKIVTLLDDKIALQRMYNQLFLYLLLMTVVTSLIIIYFDIFFLHHFGEGYLNARPLLMLACIAMSVRSYANLNALFLRYGGHVHIYTYCMIAVVIMNAVSLLVFGFSLYGIGYAVMFTSAFFFVLMIYYVRKILSLRTFIWF